MPDAARSLGRSMRILKAEVQDLHADHDRDDEEKQAQPAPALAAPQIQQDRIDQLQQQIRDLQQQSVTVNGAGAQEAPRTQQPG
jgi:sec-independent protein translocase protein TatA